MVIDIDALANDCFSEFGKPATYTPPLGVAIDVTVIMGADISQNPSGGELSVIGLAETADIRKSEVTLPVRDATLIVDGVTYRIAEVDPPVAGRSRLFLEQP